MLPDDYFHFYAIGGVAATPFSLTKPAPAHDGYQDGADLVSMMLLSFSALNAAVGRAISLLATRWLMRPPDAITKDAILEMPPFLIMRPDVMQPKHYTFDDFAATGCQDMMIEVERVRYKTRAAARALSTQHQLR